MPKKKILMIDDEEDFCHFVKLNLEKSGKYQVATSTGGRDCLNLAKRDRPDLILLDIVMQDMDGGEVAWKLMNNWSINSIPIVFITAVLNPSEEGNVGGRHNFLAKPVSPEKIMKKIEAVLQTS